MGSPGLPWALPGPAGASQGFPGPSLALSGPPYTFPELPKTSQGLLRIPRPSAGFPRPPWAPKPPRASAGIPTSCSGPPRARPPVPKILIFGKPVLASLFEQILRTHLGRRAVQRQMARPCFHGPKAELPGLLFRLGFLAGPNCPNPLLLSSRASHQDSPTASQKARTRLASSVPLRPARGSSIPSSNSHMLFHPARNPHTHSAKRNA